MDEEACPTIALTKDALCAASSVHPAMGAAVCMDDGPNYALSTNEVVVVPSHAMFAEDASSAVSPIYPTTDVLAYADDSSGHAVST